ncbi:DUF2461 domain-containing protein [Tessaracoccus sp. MC1865]|uniref:DUF2461 domain-containing protein n=1 Tax=Tessaracoccus sp. MC1865 TaxID=2760310 RepID=UPI0015FFC3D7|nr:DUF2461 domain-containing protein [Tessaracoccus sp. MC1865]MBB1483021.1 DUF2461 domain-containing protein [Tessaracoccus sp. MC1865]QTO37546.1 DUF2461 domain-containing protein [Tessaracoccus sp. MC1865]
MDAFPLPAAEFYRELMFDNTRDFWLANKARYDNEVRGPLTRVVAALAEEFGEAKVYRPYKDVRFAKDKSPYKTHQGAYVAMAPACGFYVEVNAEEAFAGGGFYRAEPEALARFRAAIDDERSGGQLQAMVEGLERDGWLITGQTLATAPRGFTKAHPRIRLLRHRSLSAMREVTATGVEAFAEEVREIWRGSAPLVDWMAARLND